MKLYLVIWHDQIDGELDKGVKLFNTRNEAQDFWNEKIDEFYAGIDDNSDYNGLSYTDYVEAGDGLDYEIENNGENFIAYLRGYYSENNFEVSIQEVEVNV